MTHTFESGLSTSDIEQQRIVQKEKFQGRQLYEYSSLIFPTQSWVKPKSSAITDFLRPVNIGEAVSLKGVLFGLCDAIPDRPVNWVDMGGGRGIAMRQLAAEIGLPGLVQMTNIDLFDYGFHGLNNDEIAYLESAVPNSTSSDVEPRLVLSDVTTVTLPEPADVITSIEVMQYLNNPLAALCNWYNELQDGGYMLIATNHDWASWIRYERDFKLEDEHETPTKHFLDILDAAKIEFAITHEPDWSWGGRPNPEPDSFSKLAIKKKPGTKLQSNTDVAKIWTNYQHYKAIYYSEQTEDTPLITVITE